MNDLQKTLNDRTKIYGKYSEGMKFRANMMLLITNRYQSHHKKVMSEIDYLCIYDIINKISRLAITPSHEDSWHDISGYSSLIEQYYKEKRTCP